MTKEENLLLSVQNHKDASRVGKILGIAERTVYKRRHNLISEIKKKTFKEEKANSFSTKIKKIVAAGDFHSPYENKELFHNFLRFLEDFAPDIFIMGGDNMDVETISFWLKNKRKKLEGKRVKKEYEYYNENIHKPIKERLRPNTKKYWFKGNHEDRIRKALDENPESEGYWEIENNIDLSDWIVVEYPKAVKIGKVYFMHGIYTNKYYTEKTVDTFEKNTVVFHKHTFQAYTKITPINNESHTCIGVPGMCNLNPEYRKDKPNSWLNGFISGYILPDGNFNLYPVIATNNHFVWEGKEY